jgi:biotin transport system substrate-specific component
MTIIRQPVAAPDWAGALTRPIGPSLAGVLLGGFALLLAITSGFVLIDLPLPGKTSTLLVPVCMGIGAFFGIRLGVWVTAAYLLVGLLGWPVFANGGGLDYWQQPGFAYLLALPVAAGCCGYFLYRWRVPVFAPVMAVVVPLLVLHTLGAVGLCVQAALGVVDASALPGWINSLTLQVFCPELAMSAVTVWLVVPMMRLLTNWLL